MIQILTCTNTTLSPIRSTFWMLLKGKSFTFSFSPLGYDVKLLKLKPIRRAPTFPAKALEGVGCGS